MLELMLGGRFFKIEEPCFKDLKILLTAFNQLNHQPTDRQIAQSIQTILTALLGECHVKNFRRFSWQAWKTPAPSPEELQTLLQLLPDLLGLKPAESSANQSNKGMDWDALYWRVIRATGWTWQQVDQQMTLSRLSALSEHLNEHPLADDLIAAYLGYEAQKTIRLEDQIDNWLATQQEQSC